MEECRSKQDRNWKRINRQKKKIRDTILEGATKDYSKKCKEFFYIFLSQKIKKDRKQEIQTKYDGNWDILFWKTLQKDWKAETKYYTNNCKKTSLSSYCSKRFRKDRKWIARIKIERNWRHQKIESQDFFVFLLNQHIQKEQRIE